MLCAALDPNVAVLSDSKAGGIPIWTDAGGEEVVVHPSSVNHGLTTPQFNQHFIVYLEKVRQARVCVHM